MAAFERPWSKQMSQQHQALPSVHGRLPAVGRRNVLPGSNSPVPGPGLPTECAISPGASVQYQTGGEERVESQTDYDARVKTYYTIDLPAEIQNGACHPSGTYAWSRKDGIFAISVAKLYGALHRGRVDGYGALEGNSELFKLNLYPIAFRDTTGERWTQYHLDTLTGLASKDAYRTWCFLNRFPSLAGIVRNQTPAPRLIIGLGLSYLVDFFACFAGLTHSGAVEVAELNAGDKCRPVYWSTVNGGRTTLAVLPFFSSRNGLNSDALVQRAGSLLADIAGFCQGAPLPSQIANRAVMACRLTSALRWAGARGLSVVRLAKSKASFS